MDMKMITDRDTDMSMDRDIDISTGRCIDMYRKFLPKYSICELNLNMYLQLLCIEETLKIKS
jgi:hypothetical protein